MTGIFIILGVVIFLLIVFTSTGRTLARTFFGFFVQDGLKNPKVAEAVLANQIEEEQEKYARASNLVNNLAGQRQEQEDNIRNWQRELSTVESNCETLAKQKNVEGLNIMASKRALLMEKIEHAQLALNKIIPMLEDATGAKKQLQENIQKKQHQKEIRVNELVLNTQLDKLYSQLDELRVDTTTEKWVAKIDDNIKTAKRNAVGAKVNYEGQISTQEMRLEQQLKQNQNEEFVQSLLNKYNKK